MKIKLSVRMQRNLKLMVYELREELKNHRDDTTPLENAARNAAVCGMLQNGKPKYADAAGEFAYNFSLVLKGEDNENLYPKRIKSKLNPS